MQNPILYCSMHRECGSSRVAYVGEYTTVKVAAVDVMGPMKDLIAQWRRGHKDLVWQIIFGEEKNHCIPYTIRTALRGIFANKREGESWSSLREIVLPTRSLFGGVLAVQQTTEDLRTPFATTFWDIVMDHFDECRLMQEGVHHTFTGIGNFGFGLGGVKLRDFGGIGVPDFLRRNHQAMRQLLRGLAKSELSLRRG